MEVNWNLCIICQEEKHEALRCPLDASGSSAAQKSLAYQSFLNNVSKFRDICMLPAEIKVVNNVEQLVDNRALWHKSCHAKFNNNKLERAQKKAEKMGTVIDDAANTMEPRCKHKKCSNEKCIFCEGEGDLHSYSTFDSEKNLRKMAQDLGDTRLLAKISGGDLVAIEAKYHLRCLVDLRNEHRSLKRTAPDQDTEDEKVNESIAFVELVCYVKQHVEQGTLLFKLSKLHSLYVDRLENLGIKKTINRTRLKNKLLEHFPDAQDLRDGKNNIIVFDEGMRKILKDALKKQDYLGDAQILAKAAEIIRRDIFQHNGFKFSGSFSAKSQE
jgi:hypothetical protein